MKKMVFGMALALAVVLGGVGQAKAGVVAVGPFTGSLTETWESFPNYIDNGFNPLSDPTTIMGGGASISNPVMFVYSPSAGATFGLASSGPAQVSDGVNGMGINTSASTTTITFADPVSAFGAYWGAATGFGFPDPASVAVSFFDVFGNPIDAVSFLYSHSGTGDGGLDWNGWSSSVGIKTITYTGDFVVIDGLQANAAAAVPEPASMTLLGLGAVSLVGYGLRRRKQAVTA